MHCGYLRRFGGTDPPKPSVLSEFNWETCPGDLRSAMIEDKGKAREWRGKRGIYTIILSS